MRVLLSLALLAVALGLSSCLPVSSSQSGTQHRVQSGNGKGHLIDAILGKRLDKYLENRLNTHFAGLMPEEAKFQYKPTGKLQLKAKPDAAPAAASSTALGVMDYFDMFWLGNVTIGTPEQGPYSVIYDTGSADLWVVDVSCGNDPRSLRTHKQCAQAPQFNSSLSSSYVADSRRFGIRYGGGNYAVGFQGTDTVKIADANGGTTLTIPNTGFAQANNLDAATLNSPIQGILGLGYQCSSVNAVVPPILNAAQQGLLSQSIFTIYLETEASESNTVDPAPAGGVFTFGAMDSTNCGNVVGWTDLSSLMFWQFSYDSINVGTTSVQINGADVISDSGTSLLIGDFDIVMQIGDAVGATFNEDYMVYLIDCDATYDPVTFTFGGNSYNLTSSVLNIDIGIGSNTCLFGAIPAPFMTAFMGIDWILGDPFIRQYCAVHDMVGQRIGFAPALAMQS